MFIYQNIMFILTLIFLISGCGTENIHETNKTVVLNDQPLNSDDINVTKAIKIIKNQVTNIVDIYVAKDRKNLFLYRESKYNYTTYWLQDYDITGEIPKFRNEIFSGTELYNEIIHLIPLKNGKLLYQAGVFSTRVVIYDYIMKKKLRVYKFFYIPEKIQVSLDDNFLMLGKQDGISTVGEQKFDISDIYQENTSTNDNQNNIIWQTDATNNTYTLDEAIKICASKPKYHWRLPTMQDIINTQSQSTQGKKYWLQPSNNSTTYSFTYSNNGHHDIYNDYRDDYNLFEYEYGTMKYFVQCVADIESN